jgi:hypothetical protein
VSGVRALTALLAVISAADFEFAGDAAARGRGLYFAIGRTRSYQMSFAAFGALAGCAFLAVPAHRCPVTVQNKQGRRMYDEVTAETAASRTVWIAISAVPAPAGLCACRGIY